MIRILGMSGSLRVQSSNITLLRAAAKLASSRATIAARPVAFALVYFNVSFELLCFGGY